MILSRLNLPDILEQEMDDIAQLEQQRLKSQHDSVDVHPTDITTPRLDSNSVQDGGKSDDEKRPRAVTPILENENRLQREVTPTASESINRLNESYDISNMSLTGLLDHSVQSEYSTSVSVSNHIPTQTNDFPHTSTQRSPKVNVPRDLIGEPDVSDIGITPIKSHFVKKDQFIVSQTIQRRKELKENQCSSKNQHNVDLDTNVINDMLSGIEGENNGNVASSKLIYVNGAKNKPQNHGKTGKSFVTKLKKKIEKEKTSSDTSVKSNLNSENDEIFLDIETKTVRERTPSGKLSKKTLSKLSRFSFDEGHDDSQNEGHTEGRIEGHNEPKRPSSSSNDDDSIHNPSIGSTSDSTIQEPHHKGHPRSDQKDKGQGQGNKRKHSDGDSVSEKLWTDNIGTSPGAATDKLTKQKEIISKFRFTNKKAKINNLQEEEDKLTENLHIEKHKTNNQTINKSSVFRSSENSPISVSQQNVSSINENSNSSPTTNKNNQTSELTTVNNTPKWLVLQNKLNSKNSPSVIGHPGKPTPLIGQTNVNSKIGSTPSPAWLTTLNSGKPTPVFSVTDDDDIDDLDLEFS